MPREALPGLPTIVATMDGLGGWHCRDAGHGKRRSDLTHARYTTRLNLGRRGSGFDFGKGQILLEALRFRSRWR